MNQQKIEFYSVGEAYGEFSNFSAHPIKMAGKVWPRSEHYFQAMKFLDRNDREKVRKANSPAIAARMGRSRKLKLRPDWQAVKLDVMYRAVKCKVEQHQDVRELLISTGDAKIVEHTANDSYWGNGGDGSGANHLGRILMRIRDELKK